MSLAVDSTYARLSSPLDLAAAARVELPSPAVEAALAALYGLAPTAEDKAVWKRISRQPWPKKRARRGAYVWGRRGLKTSGVLAWSCVFETLCGGHEKYAAPGSRIYAVVIAPRLEQSREAIRAIRGVLESLAPLGVTYDQRDANGTPELVITSPAAPVERVITVMTCDSVTVRSKAVFFVSADEAGRWPSESWLAERDVDVIAAVRGAMAQFPDALEIYTSNPGRPGSYFHTLATKPKAGTLVSTAASWVTNPRISEARCLELADGSREVFEQEYAATRWGASGGAFLDAAAVWAALGSEHAGKGKRPGHFIVGLDVGQVVDDGGIVAVSSFEKEIDPRTAPVRHVVVEHAESIASSKKNPLPTAALVARVAAVSRAFNYAPILFDQYCAVDVKEELRKLGYREHSDPDRAPPRRTFMQCSMAPQHQTPRWLLLQSLVNGRRLHLADDEELAKELVGLTATQLSSGALKVEGRKDNVADALALTLPYAVRLAPTDGPSGGIKRDMRVSFDASEGLDVKVRWYREEANGSRVPVDWPRWSPGFEQWAEDMLSRGISTPSIEAWKREREAEERQQTKKTDDRKSD